jgi:hypothetical protein
LEPDVKFIPITTLSMLLCGCASHTFGPGMNTTLSPGQRLDLNASGPDPVANVVNKGPGNIHVEQEGVPYPLIVLRPTDSTSLRMYRPMAVVNRSDARAGVEVLITGAQSANIRGPVNTGR